MHEGERARELETMAASALATRLGRGRERQGMRWMDCQRETDSITRFNVKAAALAAVAMAYERMAMERRTPKFDRVR